MSTNNNFCTTYFHLIIQVTVVNLSCSMDHGPNLSRSRRYISKNTILGRAVFWSYNNEGVITHSNQRQLMS